MYTVRKQNACSRHILQDCKEGKHLKDRYDTTYYGECENTIQMVGKSLNSFTVSNPAEREKQII